jgi:hypothetical protein
MAEDDIDHSTVVGLQKMAYIGSDLYVCKCGLHVVYIFGNLI